MTGELALTERDRALLAEVSRFGVISREQLTRLEFFGSKTRANERLKRLVAAGYLFSIRQPLDAGGPRFIYAPGPALDHARSARRRVAEGSGLFVAHQLGLVDIRIAFERHTAATRWLADRELADLALGVVPDAYVEYQVSGLTYSAFVEYDRGTEVVARIERKARAYLDLAYGSSFERHFARKFFRALLITDSEKRLRSLSRAVAAVTQKVVRLALLRDLSTFGPLAPVWRRPGSDALETLTGAKETNPL